MDYSSMIYDYMENALDREAESDLFRELYSNEELRAEFRQATIIEATMQKDSASLSPSVAAIEKTFGRLGFVYNAPPQPAEPSAPIPTPSPVGKSFFSGAFGASLVSSLVTAGLTAFVFLFLLKPDKVEIPHTPERANILSESQPKIDVSMSENRGALPAERSSEAKTRLPYNNDNKGALTENNSGSQIAPARVESNITSMPNIDSASLDRIDYSRPVYFVLLPGETKIQFVGALPEVKSEPTPSKDMKGLEVQFNNFIKSYYHPKAQLKESSSPFLGNIGVSARYAVTDKFALGLDLRNEFYYQEYEGKDGEKNFKYLQFPNLVSLSLAGRYKWLERGELGSYIEMQLGGNKAGAAGRLSALIAYQPDPAYKFILGLEGSEFLYYHGAKYFWTTKYGILYGVAVTF